MPHQLEIQLERLADLLVRRGMEPFFRNPLLTPEAKWFPEEWTADLFSARNILLRFANYAGLESLGVEVGLFVRDNDWLPDSIRSQGVVGGAAASFMGIEDDTAYFAVESRTLAQPDLLVGVLAHEMAHAWRHRMGLPVEERRLEEELTDLTTVVLGWGILTTNAAYQYHSSGKQIGVQAVTQWSHGRAGYLPVEVMSGLLAVQAVARGEELREVKRHLGTTQAEEFEKAVRWLEEVDLNARLGLPSESERPVPEMDRAREMKISMSRAGAALHDVVVQLLSRVGEAGGIGEFSLPLSVPPLQSRHSRLAVWGRADDRGGWLRELLLVSDPEWATNAVVLECTKGETFDRCAVGHLTDKVCSNKKTLVRALEAMFDPKSPHASRLFPAPPGLVLVSAPAVLGANEIERLFLLGTRWFDSDSMAKETSWLKSYGGRVRARLVKEAGGRAPVPVEPSSKDPRLDWWRFVSDPAQADNEIAMLGWRADADRGDRVG